MSADVLAETLHLATELRRLLPMLQQGMDEIPEQFGSALRRFQEACESSQLFQPAGAMAGSLVALLEHTGGRIGDPDILRQVDSISRSLLDELEMNHDDSLREFRVPLVTPIVPTEPRANKRIALFIDSMPQQLLLEESLAQSGFTPVAIASPEDLLHIDDDEVPAAIVADLNLCCLSPQCGDIFTTLRQRLDPPPHLFCLADSTDIPARLEAVRLGATRFISKPVDIGRLISVLKGVTAQTRTQPFRVALIDDHELTRSLYEEALTEAGLETLAIGNPLQAPQLIGEFKPDVVISDIYMPGCNGLELLALLRQDDDLADTAIILLSSENDTERRLEALDLGADDFLNKPVDLDILEATVVARAKRARMLKRSRSEYRRLRERLGELERQQSGTHARGGPENGFQLEELFPEDISVEDFLPRPLSRKHAQN